MRPRSKILAVDDHPANIEILQEMLDEEYHLETATTGEDALTMAEELQPDIILLDIMMPGIDGYEVCRRVRANPVLRHTKIIMVSAKAMVAERLNGYEAGADDYVTKPFDEDELQSKIRVFLRLKSVEEVDQLKTDMLSLLSHEVRTPLKSILLPAQLLMSDDEITTAKRRRFGELLYSNAKRLQSFFEKVMALSAMRSRTWTFKPVPCCLCDVVRDAVSEVGRRASERNVKIAEEFSANPVVFIDSEEMKKAVVAIMDNAIRLSPAGGEMTVRILCDDEEACLSVTDRGKGIDHDFLPRIFEEFAAFDSCAGDGIDDNHAGLGLSLALSRQVVMQHGGMISAESTKGIETTFTMRLPVHSPSVVGSESTCADELETRI